MKNPEKELNVKNQIKLAKVFKAVISAGLVAPVFVSVSACEKEKPVIEETETTKTPETTAPPETTAQETAPPTTEVVQTGPVEYKGIMINPIECLRFEGGSFYFLKGNKYGGEVGKEAGRVIIDAFELNGEMKISIALRPEVIEILQQKHLEENKELRFPIPFDLEKNKGIKMVESEDYSLRFYEGIENLNWATPKIILISNVPLSAKLLSPLNSDSFVIRKNNDGSFIFSFRGLIDTDVNEINFEGKKIDYVGLSLNANGINLPENFQERLEPPMPLVTNIKIGMSFGEIIEKKFLEIIQIDSETENPNFNSEEFSITLRLCMVQGNKDGDLREATGYLQTALDNFLTVGTDKTKIPISLIPADD